MFFLGVLLFFMRFSVVVGVFGFWILLVFGLGGVDDVGSFVCSIFFALDCFMYVDVYMQVFLIIL